MNKSAISAGHQVTLNTAKEVLKLGGNAFDAAIAAHVAMYITEPCMASAGAGGFALCYKPGENIQFLDFFTQTPLSNQSEGNLDFFPIQVNFGNETEEFHIGAASMATPGSIAGIFELHNKFGTMPIKAILEPVIDLARNGVAIDKFQAYDLILLEPIMRNDPSVSSIFFNDGILKKEGDIVQFPHFEDFLQFIIEEGRDGFYKGEIGEKVSKYSIDKGGFLQRKDFENYKAEWRKPLNFNWDGKEVFVPNGPSLGGAIMAILSNELRTNGKDWVNAILATQENTKSIQKAMEYFRSHINHLNFRPLGSNISSKGTSHFNIKDKWGNAIALTCSIGEGAGYFIPNTNMQMNNMLGESFLLPNGFHSWIPNKRLNSMMTPTMVTDLNNKLKFIGGSGGAGRIPYMILQVVENILNGMRLTEAMSHPRVYVHHGTLHYESGFQISEKTRNEMPSKEWNEPSLFFGGVHSILIDEKGHPSSVGDLRRFGVSEVFDI